MSKKIKIEDLEAAIAEQLEQCSDIIYRATEEGLSAAQKVLIRRLKAASPRNQGTFQKGWKGKKKYKLQRYVGNTTVVKGVKGKIPLSNILEYSQVRGNPFIKKTYEAALPEMANAAIEGIKKGL